jgi:hypothetical protein
MSLESLIGQVIYGASQSKAAAPSDGQKNDSGQPEK